MSRSLGAWLALALDAVVVVAVLLFGFAVAAVGDFFDGFDAVAVAGGIFLAGIDDIADGFLWPRWSRLNQPSEDSRQEVILAQTDACIWRSDPVLDVMERTACVHHLLPALC